MSTTNKNTHIAVRATLMENLRTHTEQTFGTGRVFEIEWMGREIGFMGMFPPVDELIRRGECTDDRLVADIRDMRQFSQDELNMTTPNDVNLA